MVHQAVHAVVAPLFERGFIAHSYANRVRKGTHRAVARYERLRNRHRYVLRGDVFRYFPAIDHEILKSDLRRRIRCPRTLTVLGRIIDGLNPQEPVHLYYPGDDLFTPYARRRGLPIGNPTSQFFAKRLSGSLRPLPNHQAPARTDLAGAYPVADTWTWQGVRFRPLVNAGGGLALAWQLPSGRRAAATTATATGPWSPATGAEPGCGCGSRRRGDRRDRSRLIRERWPAVRLGAVYDEMWSRVGKSGSI